MKPRDQRGSATMAAVACAGVLLLLGAALGVVAALFVAHRTAQSAADLGALAGAAALVDAGDPCDEAARVVGANGASQTSCRVVGAEVVVEVEVAGPRWLGQTGDPVATARAGPVQGQGVSPHSWAAPPPPMTHADCVAGRSKDAQTDFAPTPRQRTPWTTPASASNGETRPNPKEGPTRPEVGCAVAERVLASSS